MALSLGYHCFHGRALHDSEAAAAHLADLLTDPRWPWQPALVRPRQFPGRELYPWPAGKVAGAKLRDTVKHVIRSPLTTGIKLVASRTDRLNHAWVDVCSGQAESPCYHNAAFAFDGLSLCRAHGLPAGKAIEGWIELMHELTALVEAPHAVIWAGADEMPIIALQYAVGSRRPDMVADSPRDEVVRVNAVRDELGRRWVRPPAWGTYLRSEHVAAVGGRDRIVDIVRPPVVREVGELLYVQLSAKVEDAVTPETEARRRAFAGLLAPITVPRIPTSG